MCIAETVQEKFMLVIGGSTVKTGGEWNKVGNNDGSGERMEDNT